MLVEASQGGPEAPTPPGAGHILQGLSSLQKLGGCHLHFLQFHLAGFRQGVARCHDEVSISCQSVQAPSNQSLQTGEAAEWVFPRSLSPCPPQAIAGPPRDAVQCLPSPPHLSDQQGRGWGRAPGGTVLGGRFLGQGPWGGAPLLGHHKLFQVRRSKDPSGRPEPAGVRKPRLFRGSSSQDPREGEDQGSRPFCC